MSARARTELPAGVDQYARLCQTSRVGLWAPARDGPFSAGRNNVVASVRLVIVLLGLSIVHRRARSTGCKTFGRALSAGRERVPTNAPRKRRRLPTAMPVAPREPLLLVVTGRVRVTVRRVRPARVGSQLRGTGVRPSRLAVQDEL